MAVVAGVYGKTEPEFVGCTLDKFERNGYEDSDFYAVVWDEDSQKIAYVEYDTTRAPGCGYAKIDATGDVLRKAYRYYKNEAKVRFDRFQNPYLAKEVRKGDTVSVVRGRKIPKGTSATVFWIGERYNYYSYKNEKRVGIEFDGRREFLPLDYVEVVNWEARLVHGKSRKKMIREKAIQSMPRHYRHLFVI